MEIDKERMMHNLDYMAKVNIWLVKTYREDLFKRFGVSADDFVSVSKMFDEIYKEQSKEMQSFSAVYKKTKQINNNKNKN